MSEERTAKDKINSFLEKAEEVKRLTAKYATAARLCDVSSKNVEHLSVSLVMHFEGQSIYLDAIAEDLNSGTVDLSQMKLDAANEFLVETQEELSDALADCLTLSKSALEAVRVPR